MSKPSRFIINTDFATLKNDAEGQISLTIPSTVNVTPSANVVYKAELKIGASAGAGFRCYITSSKYNYAIMSSSFMLAATQDGYESAVPCDVSRKNADTFEIRATFNGTDGATTRYTNVGQTLTLHIQTFINPFDPV